MRHEATLRRTVRVALAALVLVGGTALGAGEAEAAPGRQTGTSTKTKLTVTGSVTQHGSCEGQLAVSVKYTRKTSRGERTVLRAATIDDSGKFSTTLSHARTEVYYVSAVLLGHQSGALAWPEDRLRVRRKEAYAMDLGTLRIPSCKA